MKTKLVIMLAAALVVAAPVFANDDATTTQPGVSQTTVEESTDSTSAALSSEATTLVNINTADLKTLLSLKGFGKKHAQAIIAYRTANGPFKSLEDLTKVKGLNKNFLKKHVKQLTTG